MKLKLMISLFLLAAKAMAVNELPELPAKCFVGKNFCVETKVIETEETTGILVRRKVSFIQVKVFVELNSSEYTVAQAAEKFFTFEDWPTYAEGSENVKFKASIALTKLPAGITHRHFAVYESKAPFPIRKMEMTELTQFKKMSPVGNAELSYSFAVVKDTNIEIPGHGNYTNPIKLDDKRGELHVEKVAGGKKLRLYLITDVFPSIKAAPTLAAPYIENGIVDIAKGMFSL